MGETEKGRSCIGCPHIQLWKKETGSVEISLPGAYLSGMFFFHSSAKLRPQLRGKQEICAEIDFKEELLSCTCAVLSS